MRDTLCGWAGIRIGQIVPRFTVFVLYQILLFLTSLLCNTAGALPSLSNIVGFLSADHEIFVRFFFF